MPKARYRLKASKVDRIAIVDRPCVPDAQIVVFKRMGVDMPCCSPQYVGATPMGSPMSHAVREVDFNAEYAPRALGSAIDVLEGAFFQPLVWMSEFSSDEKTAYWNELFAGFRDAVRNVVTNLTTTKQDASTLTTEEIQDKFREALKVQALQSSFSVLRQALMGLMYERVAGNLYDAVMGIVDDFQTYVVQMGSGITADDSETVEEAGNTVYEMGQKRKDAVLVLGKIMKGEVIETEEKAMTLQELITKVDTLTAEIAKVAAIQASITKIEEALKAKGILVDAAPPAQPPAAQPPAAQPPAQPPVQKSLEEIEAEKKAAEELEKAKAEELEKAKALEVEKAKEVEAEKAKAEAEVLTKRRTALSLPETATLEEIEKREQEIVDAEKKFKADLPARLDAVEKFVAEFSKFTKTLEKKFGMKTSVDIEGAEKGASKGDVFADALRGKKA